VALIGDRNAGKSHFIVTTLHEFEHRVGDRFGASLILLDDYTMQLYHGELHPRLYEQGKMLLNTQSSRAAASTVRAPLAAMLTVGQYPKLSYTNLIFFDSAGEDLGRLDVMEREARYITQADAVIMLIDPLQIPAIRNSLRGVDLPDPSREDQLSLLVRFAALLREARALSARAPIPMPLAITVSKLDAIRPLLDPGNPVLEASSQDRFFEWQRAKDISEFLRAEVSAWLGEGFDRFVRQNFRYSSYFGVSALGSPPRNGQLTHGVSAFRVEDPLLWLLARWGGVATR
jgi:hypothetical protein